MKRITNNQSQITDNHSPLVSVVIPVFNGAKYLIEAVESIQKNTYKNIEILLIDDGSKDTSKALCKQLEQTYPNVRFYDFTNNRGLGRVLNFALKKAKGKYICRLNQDDIMLPFRIQTQVNYLVSHPDITAVGSSIRLFDNKYHTQVVKFIKQDAEIKKIWYIVSPFSDPSVMYRKDIALNVGGYDQYYWPADDTHLWYRMGLAGKLANIQRPLVNVRWHKDAASVKFFRKLAWKTYQMHNWTHKNISPAPWYIQFYWICQLLAGYIFSPEFNWNVYRLMKKYIAYYEDRNGKRFQKNPTPAILRSVPIQPKKFSLSGE